MSKLGITKTILFTELAQALGDPDMKADVGTPIYDFITRNAEYIVNKDAENERLKGEIVDRQGAEESLTKWVADLGDEVDRLKGEVGRLREHLYDAKLQIEYLHGKFQETGSGNAVLSRIETALTLPPSHG